MYLLKPTGPNVKDALTGEDMPPAGVKREILLPPDHYAQRTGDITIEELKDPEPQAAQATPAQAVAAKADKHEPK